MQAMGAGGLLTALDAVAASDTCEAQNDNPGSWEPTRIGAPMMRDPVWVYDNWSAYTDGISPLDGTRLTEELAMKELQEVVRLKRLGVHFDYYMMNAFWFAPDGAYRQWRQPDWPHGPDRWLAACQENGLKAGLWFSTNSLWKINVAPQWRDSLALQQKPERPGFDVMSFYEGGFLTDFMNTVQYWYDRGIRMFEFDIADFDAATPAARKTQSAQEIRSRNQVAFSDALKAFRRKNPDAMLVAFNDYGGDVFEPTTNFSTFKKPIDLRWLEAFDTLYCGDIHASDVPQANFWRSVDLYSDHMVRRFEHSGVPLERIDPVGFTLSTTWFGYNRKTEAWRGMLLLTAARGGWKKTIYGNLELLSDDDARWFATVQGVYAPLLAMGRTKTFGGIPGEVEPYGFGSFDLGGAIYTVVNPTQEVRTIDLPLLSRVQSSLQRGRVLFRDAGFVPLLKGSSITMGPGQMAVAGFGRYAAQEYDLGVQQDVVIPRKIEPMNASFRNTGTNAIEATVTAPSRGDLRILFQQRSQDGAVLSSPSADTGSLTSPEDLERLYSLRMEQIMKIEALQHGKIVPVERDQTDKVVAFGISWGAGEIRNRSFIAGQPITIRCSSAEKKPAVLEGHIYTVEY